MSKRYEIGVKGTMRDVEDPSRHSSGMSNFIQTVNVTPFSNPKPKKKPATRTKAPNIVTTRDVGGERGERGERGEVGEVGETGLLPIEGEPLFGDILKYDGNNEWILTGSINLYIGHGTLENLSNDNAKYNIGLGYKAGIGQDHPSKSTDGAIAIGYQAGGKTRREDGEGNGEGNEVEYQSSGCIAIGMLSANKGQGEDSVAIGTQSASDTAQNIRAIAVGFKSGCESQGESAVAVGDSSGCTAQGKFATSIGKFSGNKHQDEGAVAVGSYAGMGIDAEQRQGKYSIAIGFKAACSGQVANSIVLDASGEGEMEPLNKGCYVKPIRLVEDSPGLLSLKYDPESNEVVAIV